MVGESRNLVRYVSFWKPVVLTVMVAVLFAAAALLAGCGSSSSTTRTIIRNEVVRNHTLTQPSSPTASLADVVSRIKSGVVRIEADTCSGTSIGTGFLVSPRLIATVEHVVDGASTIRIKQGDRLVATGQIVGADPSQDLALVLTDHPVTGRLLRLASRTPRLGESVAAIGFPLGLPLSVTQGTVSGLNRTVPILGYDRQNLIQTDAAVNPGNSGGPLVSVQTGDVIGLVDLLESGANGLGFAVSGGVARPQFSTWEAKHQQVRSVRCSGSSTPAPSIPPSALPPTGIPPTLDSGNPCDPSSTAYDPNTCNGGTTSTDSGDPCDPSSTAYDPNTCSGGTTSTDSGDPCDPSSTAYDPNTCNGGTTSTTSTTSTAYDPATCNGSSMTTYTAVDAVTRGSRQAATPTVHRSLAWRPRNPSLATGNHRLCGQHAHQRGLPL
jgi:hypothetical protein